MPSSQSVRTPGEPTWLIVCHLFHNNCCHNCLTCHQQHVNFNVVFIRTYQNCTVLLDNMYTIEGVVMCEKDYQELVSSWPCAACGKAIPPDGHDALMVGDVRFHHACLECEVCHKNMEGKVVTLDKENKVYCTEDFNRLDMDE